MMQARSIFVNVAWVSGLCSVVTTLLIYSGELSQELGSPVPVLNETPDHVPVLGQVLASPVPGPNETPDHVSVLGLDPRVYSQVRTHRDSRVSDAPLVPDYNKSDGAHNAKADTYPADPAPEMDTKASTPEDTPATPINATVTCPTRARWEHVERTCHEQGLAGKPLERSAMKGGQLHVIVDHQHQLMCCLVPKSGTTSLRYFMGKLVVDLQTHMMYPLGTYLNYTGFQSLRWLSDGRRETVLQDYMKFVFVRHPLGKLLSVYNNKMKKAGGLNQQVLRGVRGTLADQYLHKIGVLGSNETFDPLRLPLTFHQFLYLVGNKYAEGFIDEHWRTQQSACLFCQIRYDHYLRLETFEEDTKVVTNYLKSIGVTGDLVIAQQNAKPVKGGIPGVDERFKTINEAFADVDEGVMGKLLAVYRNDFLLFGYGWSREQGATCDINRGYRSSCC